MNKIKSIKKRNGIIEEFQFEKITNAILKAMKAAKEGGEDDARNVSLNVVKAIEEKYEKTQDQDFLLTIENIQNLVEQKIMESGFYNTAKAYILYREQRKQLREIEDKMSVSLVDNYLDQLD